MAVIRGLDTIKARLDHDRLALFRGECERSGETNMPHAKWRTPRRLSYQVFRTGQNLVPYLDHTSPSIGIFRAAQARPGILYAIYFVPFRFTVRFSLTFAVSTPQPFDGSSPWS